MSEDANTQTQTLSITTQEAEPVRSVLEQILDEVGVRPDDQAERTANRNLLEAYIAQLSQSTERLSKSTIQTVNAWVAKIDEVVSDQLNDVMHTKEFQQMEASWRGLWYLVSKTEVSSTLKIRVLDVTKDELSNDFEYAGAFDQSSLFKKVYAEQYDMYGGEPYGTMIGDFEFTKHPQDLELIKNISNVVAAAHCPFISAAGSELFGWKGYTDMANAMDISRVFGTAEYASWKSFRESEDSRYVGLCLPHILLRLPYGEKTKKTRTFNFEEDVDGKDHKKYLWGNAAYAFGTRVTGAFAKYGWCVAIRGEEGGGLVEDLPAHTFETDYGEVALKCPTEIAISGSREKEFADAGFMAMEHRQNYDMAVFRSAQSCQKPATYSKTSATANAKLSTQLPYIFAVSRFAHYLKQLMNAKVGAFMSRQNCEDLLKEWINQYVLENDDAGQEMKAKYPLSAAQVDVAEIPGQPGAYKAKLKLRPHLQLDKIDIDLSLVQNFEPKQ